MGRGTWQVVLELLSVVRVVLLSRRLLRVYQTRHIIAISDSYRYHKNQIEESKEPNALINKPKT